MLLAGCQLDRSNFHKETHQGYQALVGQNTEFFFVLDYTPFSEEALWLFLDGRIAVNGRDFSVDLDNRKITWLSTAPYGVTVSNWIEINYFTR